jgi:serine/threonine protein kinase
LSCFKGKNFQAILDENRKCSITFDKKAWEVVSDECKELLARMLEKKPINRISCDDILTSEWILKHTNPGY